MSATTTTVDVRPAALDRHSLAAARFIAVLYHQVVNTNGWMRNNFDEAVRRADSWDNTVTIGPDGSVRCGQHTIPARGIAEPVEAYEQLRQYHDSTLTAASRDDVAKEIGRLRQALAGGWTLEAAASIADSATRARAAADIAASEAAAARTDPSLPLDQVVKAGQRAASLEVRARGCERVAADFARRKVTDTNAKIVDRLAVLEQRLAAHTAAVAAFDTWWRHPDVNQT